MKTFLVFSLLLLGSANTAGQQLQSFKVDDYDLLHPLVIKELNRPGPHAVNISRRFANESEERLLRIAEAVYSAGTQVDLKRDRIRESGIGVMRMWWCSEFDGVRVPYAITKSAVAYYLEASDEFREAKPRIPFWIKMKMSSLTYSASVAHKESYQRGETTLKDVYVVSMNLGWSQFCGGLCGMAFQKSRTVVLNGKSEVLAVDGDACESFIVS
jgi:hypothetical protein